MAHDCRFCICVSCYPWEEGIHNFRHPGRAEACDCDHCPLEYPLYPDYPAGRNWKKPTPGTLVAHREPGPHTSPLLAFPGT